MMTLNELIAEAKKIKGWRLRGNEIRCKLGYCPVVAVAAKRFPDDHFFNKSYRSASARLKLRESVADRVATAADVHEESLTVKEALLRRRLIEELIPKSRRPKAA